MPPYIFDGSASRASRGRPAAPNPAAPVDEVEKLRLRLRNLERRLNALEGRQGATAPTK